MKIFTWQKGSESDKGRRTVGEKAARVCGGRLERVLYVRTICAWYDTSTFTSAFQEGDRQPIGWWYNSSEGSKNLLAVGLICIGSEVSELPRDRLVAAWTVRLQGVCAFFWG